MPILFVIFIFGSIVLGAGVMLAPALPTRSPRIGLAAALVLAFVVSGGIFYASLFGWNTLVIDYLWFALLVGIFLTGTMSAGMYRAESEGGTRQFEGWPGPRELLFLAVVAMIFILPALIVPVPLDTDAQGFGYLALMLKLGGKLQTLAPFHPEVTYLYSPGFPALAAYLSAQLHTGLHSIQMALGAVMSFLFVWVAYDFGNEIASEQGSDSRLLGIVMASCALLGTGFATAYMDSHFTAVMGLLFGLAFITFVLRFQREGRRADFLAAAVTLAAMPLAQPDMTIVIGLAFAPWALTMWANRPRITVRRWLLTVVGIPLLAILGVLPWLAQIAPLLTSEIRSPFEISATHWIVLTVYHGGLIVLLALGGILLRLRRRTGLDLMMLGWLLLVIDFSTVGLLKTLFPWFPLFKYDYPFSIAWHGPIIPYMYFAAQALLWLIERLGQARVMLWLRRGSVPVLVAIIVVVLVIGANSDSLIQWSKTTPFKIYGAFSSVADLKAMRWLVENTPAEAVILNHPGDHEGDWAPVIMERNTVFFRPQPFFRHTEQIEASWVDLRAFWSAPSAPENEALLRRYNIRYVLVPQIVTRPETLSESAFRWRPPTPPAQPYLNRVSEMPYLRLLQDFDGAQVYEVIPR